MKKLLLCAAAMMMLLCPQTGWADDSVDMAAITCREFMDNINDEKEMTIILSWLDGYLSAKSGNTRLDDDWLESLATQLVEYCSAYPNRTVMDAVQHRK